MKVSHLDLCCSLIVVGLLETKCKKNVKYLVKKRICDLSYKDLFQRNLHLIYD